MFIENEYPPAFQAPSPNPYPYVSDQNSDLQIYEIKLSTGPTINQKIQLIKDLHQQGMNLILNRASP